MASQIQIVNSALIKLGASPTLTIDDSNKRARAMKAMWELSRDGLLRSYRWSFAMKRVTLASLADEPDFGFDKQFQLPADFLRLDYVSEFFVGLSMSDIRNSDESDYSIEGTKLLCDLADPLPIRYVSRVSDTSLLDACFVDALACRLAYDTCEEITQSSTKKVSILQDFDIAIRNAVRVNAIEKPPQPVADDSWMVGRI